MPLFMVKKEVFEWKEWTENCEHTYYVIFLLGCLCLRLCELVQRLIAELLRILIRKFLITNKPFPLPQKQSNVLLRNLTPSQTALRLPQHTNISRPIIHKRSMKITMQMQKHAPQRHTCRRLCAPSADDNYTL